LIGKKAMVGGEGNHLRKRRKSGTRKMTWLACGLGSEWRRSQKFFTSTKAEEHAKDREKEKFGGFIRENTPIHKREKE